MKNKKGFTLVELLAVIVILAIVMGIGIVIAMGILNNAKRKTYQVTLNEVTSNANQYVLENSDKISFKKITVNGNNIEYACVTVQNLIDYGYLDKNVVRSDISEDEKIEANKYVYLERDINSKNIIKKLYLGNNSDNDYVTRCGGSSTPDVSSNKYTITYDANGGTGTMDNTTCNENEDCLLKENGFTKEGYTFDGWYNSPSDGTKYEETIRLTSNIIVYAGWKKQTITITYKYIKLCDSNITSTKCDGQRKEVIPGQPYGELCDPIEPCRAHTSGFDTDENGFVKRCPTQVENYRYWFSNLGDDYKVYDLYDNCDGNQPCIIGTTEDTEVPQNATDHTLYLFEYCGGDSSLGLIPQPYYVGGGWFVPATGEFILQPNAPDWNGTYSQP